MERLDYETVAERVEFPLYRLAAIMRATVDRFGDTRAERDITPADAEVLAGHMEAFAVWCDHIYRTVSELTNDAELAHIAQEAARGAVEAVQSEAEEE